MISDVVGDGCHRRSAEGGEQVTAVELRNDERRLPGRVGRPIRGGNAAERVERVTEAGERGRENDSVPGSVYGVVTHSSFR